MTITLRTHSGIGYIEESHTHAMVLSIGRREYIPRYLFHSYTFIKIWKQSNMNSYILIWYYTDRNFLDNFLQVVIYLYLVANI